MQPDNNPDEEIRPPAPRQPRNSVPLIPPRNLAPRTEPNLNRIFDENSVVTKFETDVYVYTAQCEWLIKNWRHAVKDGSNSFIDSPPFAACEMPEVTWHLRFWPNRQYSSNQPCQLDVAVFVNKSDCIHSAEVQCSLLSANKDVLYGSVRRNNYWGLSSRIVNRVEDVSATDIVLVCIMRYSIIESASHTNLAQMYTKTIGGSVDYLAKLTAVETTNDYKAIVNSSDYSDVSIKIGEKQFAGHKVIMAARSSVFKAMFSYDDMSENKRSLLVIEDTDVDTWDVFMSYLYSGCIDKIGDHSVELLKLADKYDLQGLKDICSKILADNLTSADQTISILILSYLHNADSLKQACFRFIKKCPKDVYRHENWKKLMVDWPALAIEVLTSVTRIFPF